MMNDHVEESLKWRYACKKFDPTKKISDRDWTTLEHSLLKAPSSYGLQPYRFLLIQTPELREKLRAVSWNQTQVTDCSHYVVMITKSKVSAEDVNQFIELTAKTRSLPVEQFKGYRDLMIKNVVEGLTGDEPLNWTRRQAYIAMGFLLETAALLRIDTTPIEGLDPRAYDDILNLKGSGYQAVAAVALGYRHPEDAYQKAAKVRRAKTEILEVR